MSLSLITAPVAEPITLAEAKIHCNVDSDLTADDALLTSIIIAVRMAAEKETKRSLMPQTWELTQDAFTPVLLLRRPPVVSITSIKYLDTAGALITLAGADYTLDTSSDFKVARVVPAYGTVWPSTYQYINAVRVRYLTGYLTAAAVPALAKSWMLLGIGTLYAQRESIITGTIVAELPDDFFCGLLDSLRVY